MSIPKVLIDEIREGRAVPFFGAGASVGAVLKKGGKPPLGKQLAEQLAIKFLGKEFADRSLAQIAELAINDSDLYRVQDFVASLYTDLIPAPFHFLIPGFYWPALITTNFDLLLETIYDGSPNKLQTPVVFTKNTDRIEERLRSPNSIQLIKLHGSIADFNDKNVPLILTTDQYITHKKGREFLFGRFKELAYNYPIIFIGTSLSDPDLRQILIELDELEETKPRSYIVAPNLRIKRLDFGKVKR